MLEGHLKSMFGEAMNHLFPDDKETGIILVTGVASTSPKVREISAFDKGAEIFFIDQGSFLIKSTMTPEQIKALLGLPVEPKSVKFTKLSA